MPDLAQLNRQAREIFDYALSAVDPREAVRRAITLDDPNVEIGEARLEIAAARVYAVAIGKAAASMASGIEEALGERLSAGVITSVLDSHRWKGFAGGHPLPNEASLEAARAAFSLLDRANSERAVVVFLVSGGGSAMIEWPVTDDISLADLRAANQVLIGCGASISEINSVRRGFSAVKGGGLARRTPDARVFTLIVSDTNAGDEASVASGPTLSPPRDAPKALEVVERYQLQNVLPESIMQALQKSTKSIEVITGSYQALLSNSTALQAAALKASGLGYPVLIRDEICEQAIDDGCHLLLFNATNSEPMGWSRRATPTITSRETVCRGGPPWPPHVLNAYCEISGGEFSCPVRGNGRGGRNLETALRCAIQLDRLRSSHVVVLSAGTDGIDGNSPAAGAIADETTIERARQLGLDPYDFLARSDSYGFFERLNDLVLTGPTGTNVRDIRIVLLSAS